MADIFKIKETFPFVSAKEIDQINVQLGKWEQVKKFELTPSVWSIETGELTPTLKLKRKIILEKYKNLYEKIYGRA